jgi:ABC-2 type transport system permease protein
MLLLSLRQLASRRRLLLIVLLAFLPVSIAVLISALAEGESDLGQDIINLLIDGMIVGAILPIVTIALATAAFGNELDDRTLSYLVLKPVPRSLIVLPKLLASIVVGGPLLIASGVVATLLGVGGGQAALAVGLALFAGAVTYATIFTWAGLVSTHALGFALIYVFLWEGLISSFLGGVRYLSVRGYTLAILHGIDDKSFEALGQRVIEFPAALVGAAAVTAVFFWLTVRRLRRMDVP